MSFLTLEDINTNIANHFREPFWDTIIIDNGTSNFTDVKFNYCTVTMEKDGSDYLFTVQVDNSLWTGKVYVRDGNDDYIPQSVFGDEDYLKFYFLSSTPNIELNLLLDLNNKIKTEDDFYLNFLPVDFRIVDFTPKIVKNSHLTHNVNLDFTIEVFDGDNNAEYFVRSEQAVSSGTGTLVDGHLNVTLALMGSVADLVLTVGRVGESEVSYYYVPVDVMKVKPSPYFHLDTIYAGKVNNITCYFIQFKNGDIDDFSVDCKYPVSLTYKTGNPLDKIVLGIDLTGKSDLNKVRLTLNYSGDRLHSSFSKEFVFNVDYDAIGTLTALQTLMSNGGTGRLSKNITLNSNLSLENDVLLIGDEHTINLKGYHIIVPEGKTFKAEKINFVNGVNSIQQYENSNVELTGCNFNNCTGLGSVIDCQVDMDSLSETNDFHTILVNCSIRDCSMAILHGGDLTITDCNVTGKITNKYYPYFLYQTDGMASIIGTSFNLTEETVFDYDIMFNTCIFMVGETGQINGFSHTQLQNNDFVNFLEIGRNSSKIDIKYFYDLIGENISLKSDTGFCHSASNVDFVFKTNVLPERI